MFSTHNNNPSSKIPHTKKKNTKLVLLQLAVAQNDTAVDTKKSTAYGYHYIKKLVKTIEQDSVTL